MDAIKDALRYVRENRTWTDAEENMAIERIGQHYPLPQKIEDAIHDLMEEWSDENGYPEGWWYYEMDELEIFYKL